MEESLPMAIRKTFFHKTMPGFTMAEILIALLILAQIATFTIPKVLLAQQDNKYNAMAREAFGIVSEIHQNAKMKSLLSSSSRFSDWDQYLNYVSKTTSGVYDDHVGYGSVACSAAAPCYKLHNGGLLADRGADFAGTGSTNVIILYFDPDGVYGGSTTGSSKSIQIILYYNGRITSRGGVSSNFISGQGVWGPSSADPSWFSW